MQFLEIGYLFYFFIWLFWDDKNRLMNFSMLLWFYVLYPENYKDKYYLLFGGIWEGISNGEAMYACQSYGMNLASISADELLRIGDEISYDSSPIWLDSFNGLTAPYECIYFIPKGDLVYSNNCGQLSFPTFCQTSHEAKVEPSELFPPINTSAGASSFNIRVCGSVVNGFHLVENVDLLADFNGFSVCNSLGLKFANLTKQSIPDVLPLLDSCKVSYEAAFDSYEGFRPVAAHLTRTDMMFQLTKPFFTSWLICSN